MSGVLALVACQFAGEIVTRVLGLPVPGPIVGMMLLLMALFGVGDVPAELERVSKLIISLLPLLVIPAGAGIIENASAFSGDALAILIALVVSTLAGLIVSGVVARALIERRGVARSEPEE